MKEKSSSYGAGRTIAVMTDNPENTDRKQHPSLFQPGQSGNPNGRPKGAKNATTLAAEALLDGEAETITRKCVELAKGGDMAAIRLCLERIVPPRKSRPVYIDLPDIEEPSDLLAAMQAVLRSVASGETAPDDANTVMALLEQTRRAQDLVDIDARLTALEDKQ